MTLHDSDVLIVDLNGILCNVSVGMSVTRYGYYYEDIQCYLLTDIYIIHFTPP